MKKFAMQDLMNDMQRIARDLQKLLAVAQGTQYYEGKPCKHGHGRRRYVATDSCVTCARAWVKASKAKEMQQ